jgi:hypothetical protein
VAPPWGSLALQEWGLPEEEAPGMNKHLGLKPKPRMDILQSKSQGLEAKGRRHMS